MKKKLFIAMGFLLFSILFQIFFSENAMSIPTLARKYKTTCMTCHATYPRLTALGEAIRLNGYKMPDGDEIYIKEEVISQGAEAYKRVFPQAVWPSNIPGPPPISLRAIGDLEVDIGDEGGDRDNRAKLTAPREVELIGLGAFGDNMSFHLEIEFEKEEDDETETDFHGWLMWEDILEQNVLNMRFGSVGAHEIALPNTRDNNRITKEHYLYRNEITNGLDGPGVELNGFGRFWRYATGYVKPESEFGDGSYYVQGSLKYGGLGFDGTGGNLQEGGLETSPAGYWRDDAILFGGFYYKGDDNIDRYGVDARWNFKDLSLAGGFLTADNDVSGLDKDVLFAEAEYFVFPWLQPYIRYESLSDDRPDSDLANILVGSVILARANVKINLEAKFFTDNEAKEAEDRDKNVDDRVFVRLDFAF